MVTAEQRKNIKDWVKALRSGDYLQGNGYLNCEGLYCCLGVLCDVIDPEGWSGEDEGSEHQHVLGHHVAPFENIDTPNWIKLTGLPEEFASTLIEYNDKFGHSFEVIADKIEYALESADGNNE